MVTKWDPSKWEIHKLYSGHPDLKKLLPHTEILSRGTLSEFLNRYSYVYIKGKNEHTGLRMIKARKIRHGYEFVNVKGDPIYTESFEDFYEQVTEGRRSSSILVQRAIDLAKIEGRPFSTRLMLMRDRREKWQYAGMLAKVAGEHSVVTNIRRGGGYAATIEHALSKSLGYSREQIERMKEKIIDTGYRLIRYAAKRGYKTYETGIDIGIDKKGQIWIIEVNLAYPSYGLFNRLEDKTYYRRIKELAAEYKKKK
ncbi:YheC/YheD family protein [Cohnella terricola]|uniref:YheC/YheD family protein n=1 Tax=Cohnella terricola TaxID=1289167 RepID=A0A559JDI9_9BACL|nr:YheC/YheD family protein [Cohnella terricola]TVX97936.1 YheC/YheD family protein [Cohnella terricola]